MEVIFISVGKTAESSGFESKRGDLNLKKVRQSKRDEISSNPGGGSRLKWERRLAEFTFSGQWIICNVLVPILPENPGLERSEYSVEKSEL